MFKVYATSYSFYLPTLHLYGSRVRIPAPYAGWTFFTLICYKNCNNVCLKKPKINEKEAGVGPFIKKHCICRTRTCEMPYEDVSAYFSNF